MAKSLFPEEMMNVSALTLESIAGKLFYFQSQLHLLHWQTASVAEHAATGSMYEYIHNFKDDLVEKIMGYTGHKPTAFKVDSIIQTTSINVANELISFAKELKKYGETNSYQDVCNLSDSFSGEVAKFKFLLTLS